MAYVTLAQIRQHGNYDADETGRDVELSALIPRATAAIEAYTNNIFEITSTSTRYFDAPIDGKDYRTLYFDEWLSDTTSLEVTNGDGSTVSSSDFVTLPRNHTPIYGLELKTSATVAWDYTTSPEDAISVVGYWGYSQSPPDDVVLACILLVLHWIRMEDQAEDKTMPEDVCMLLKPFRQAVAWL